MNFFRRFLIGALCAVFVAPAWGAQYKVCLRDSYCHSLLLGGIKVTIDGKSATAKNGIATFNVDVCKTHKNVTIDTSGYKGTQFKEARAPSKTGCGCDIELKYEFREVNWSNGVVVSNWDGKIANNRYIQCYGSTSGNYSPWAVEVKDKSGNKVPFKLKAYFVSSEGSWDSNGTGSSGEYTGGVNCPTLTKLEITPNDKGYKSKTVNIDRTKLGADKVNGGCYFKVTVDGASSTATTAPANNSTTPPTKGAADTSNTSNPSNKSTTTTTTDSGNNGATIAAAGIAAGGSKNCGGVGQKECNGSYYVCAEESDCIKERLPSNATAGHCVAAGRSGYKVCTATACGGDFEVKSGYCQKKGASSSGVSETTTQTSGITISGVVIDSETGDPVLYAAIALMQNDGVTMVADDMGCVADDEGKFSASFKDVPQDAKMRVSATGYERQFVALGQNLEIKLKPITFATESNAGGQTIEDIAEPETNTIADAEQAYADAKDKEQSTANKMLGGLSMAATGIGGMQMVQGLSEQSADADAARDMDAYLATMQCRVGDNVYKLGDAGIDVGGTNQLTELYQQYVDLAADLKERKTALGMKSGIESQVVMDSAKMGLYDDKGNGIENGTYASLYRASRGNEKDKKALDDAKESSRDRVKYGTIAAGVGVVGGVIGNELINGDDDDDDDSDVSNVKDKYTINLKKSGVNDRDVTYNFDLTRNGISNLGYNLDGRCARDINDNRTGGCDNLTTRGTWWTSFSYGTVYGEARCGTKAEHPNQNKTNMTIPCFCKIISVDRNNIKDTKWVYFTDFNDDNHCRNSCATNCSSYLSTNEELRKKSLGVILKRLDKKSNGGIDLSGIGVGLGNNLGQAAGAISGVIGGVSNDGGGMNMGQAASLIQSLGK